MSSLQTGFRSESVWRPRDRFRARSSRGLRSSASAPPIPRVRTLGSRAAAERVDLKLGGSCGDGETLTSLRTIFVVLLLLRADDSVLHSALETFLWCLLGCWSMRCCLLRCIGVTKPLRSNKDLNQNPFDCTYQDGHWY